MPKYKKRLQLTPESVLKIPNSPQLITKEVSEHFVINHNHNRKKLKQNSKNPKKVWETLKELTTGKSCNQPIEKIVKNNNTIVTELTLIAEEFNNFL